MKYFSRAQAEKELDKIFREVGENENGEINYSQWVMATINRDNLLEENRLKNVFDSLDLDKSGTLSCDEVK